jgi:hypothetical protein
MSYGETLTYRYLRLNGLIRRYKAEKHADWLRFPDDLMQYLAWKS